MADWLFETKTVPAWFIVVVVFVIGRCVLSAFKNRND